MNNIDFPYIYYYNVGRLGDWMLNDIRNMFSNNTSQGRIDVTLFFIDVFLLLCHVLLMVLYLYSKNSLMITANIFSVIIYFYFLFTCTKKVNSFVCITYAEILVHMVFACYSYGWTAGFQNWVFALLCGCFLTTYTPFNNQKMDKRPWLFSGILIIIYFVLFFFLRNNTHNTYESILYTLLCVINSIYSFIAIVLFSLFYTSKNIRRQNELSRRADYDELTSLYNRHALNQIGNNCIHQAKMAKAKFSVAIIDIDHFKKINDTYGHNKGDEVLKELSNIIRSFSIRGIIPGRWGGEEFVLIAPYTISYNEFCVILEKLREKVEEVKFNITSKKTIHLTISIGASEIRSASNIDSAVALADKNLYQAKEDGRNKLVS